LTSLNWINLDLGRGLKIQNWLDLDLGTGTSLSWLDVGLVLADQPELA
jgi:hypothetical protein